MNESGNESVNSLLKIVARTSCPYFLQLESRTGSPWYGLFQQAVKERGRNDFPTSRRALAPVCDIQTGASALRLIEQPASLRSFFPKKKVIATAFLSYGVRSSVRIVCNRRSGFKATLGRAISDWRLSVVSRTRTARRLRCSGFCDRVPHRRFESRGRGTDRRAGR